MIRNRHALVVGKFYPPHRGHERLIAAACERAERVSVVVMASGAESIPLEDRMAWLRKDHTADPVDVVGVRCEAPLDLFDDNVWKAQVAAIRAALRCIDAGPVDLVVSGEGYGERLAGYFAAAHVQVDRGAEPISATEIRADVERRWQDLTLASRAGLACRIVVVGAESTGSTTVAEALTEHYRQLGGVWEQTACVHEYGRAYTETLWDNQCRAACAAGRREPDLVEVVWTLSDFDIIADAQTVLEDQAAGAGSPLLICDTDAFATSIWERRYLAARARPDPAWARAPALSRHDLYLLTSHHGVPWVADGIREGDKVIREAMTDWFADALTGAGHPWVMLEGSLQDRIDIARRSIGPVLARRLTLADPLTGPGFPSPARP